MKDGFIDVVFDGPPGPEGPRFVEVEDFEGRSINAGEWIERGNGLWALRLRDGVPVVVNQSASALLGDQT